MADKVHIAVAADHNYLHGLQATMASMILSASDREALAFHVFADGLTEDDCVSVSALARRLGCARPIDFIRPDMSRIVSLFEPYKGSHAAFLRLFFGEFLNLDKVIYADVDTLWFRDVCRLWDEPSDGVSILWCRDIPSIADDVGLYAREWDPSFDPERYCCSGVMVMNLKRMRETKLIDRCVDFARRWGTPIFVDQDILNFVCRDDARILPRHWDLMMPDPSAREGAVLHFNGVGSMFNGTFQGWRPLYEIWFRFYYDVVLQDRKRTTCGRFRRFVLAVIGLAYPIDRVLRIDRLFKPRMRDQLIRVSYFGWLRLRSKWYGRW